MACQFPSVRRNPIPIGARIKGSSYNRSGRSGRSLFGQEWRARAGSEVESDRRSERHQRLQTQPQTHMNPLTSRVTSGTVGELLVQLRLLQFGVQAAPPLRDSGNDLIAVRGRDVRSVQVRTAWGRRPTSPKYATAREYDGVAFVRLAGSPTQIQLDQCSVYLVPLEALHELRSKGAIERHRLSSRTVDALFTSDHSH